jgi:delta1-piperideine-2-carboxylate reductase
MQMRLTIDDAERLASQSLLSLGYPDEQIAAIVPHLMDCELRGLGFSGLARVLSIAERLDGAAPSTAEIIATRETPVSAQLAGADVIGYVVGQRSTDLAIAKANSAGIGIVGADDTWYTGMLSYFAEQITASGFVAVIASNATPWVAPFGGTEARFGTNPFCLGFPGEQSPLIWDIGISEIIHAQVVLADRQGDSLPEGVAYDAAGLATTDPIAALSGAFVAWGGHKGSGLGVGVQLLGALAGSAIQPAPLSGFGFLVLVIDPELFGPRDEYRAKVAEYQRLLRDTRPADPARPVRAPFDRSIADRARRRAEGTIDVPDAVVAAVTALASPEGPRTA